MEAIVERAAGLDVHQGSVVACVIIGAAGRRPTKEVRSFGTMRQDLVARRGWLLEKGVTHVGMEGTGVYWQPVHAGDGQRQGLPGGEGAHGGGDRRLDLGEVAPVQGSALNPPDGGCASGAAGAGARRVARRGRG